MKYFIISDIHGSIDALEKALCFFQKGNYDYLFILGDILNYGPRNGLPKGLDPIAVAGKLNGLRDRIIAVRGNCDSEVDQMLLNFPCLSDYAMVIDEGARIFLSHGHIYNPENMPKWKIDFFFSGHTHLWNLEKKEETVFCNTGSLTFPKGGKEPTFVDYEKGRVRIFSLEGNQIASYYSTLRHLIL